MPSKFKIKFDRSFLGSLGDHNITRMYIKYGLDIDGLMTFHENFDGIEKQVLKVSLSLFALSAVVFIIAKLAFRDTSVYYELVRIPTAILVLSIAFVFFKSIFRQNKNRGAFWKKISKEKREIINEYLEYVESEVRRNFGNIDVTFKDIAGDSDNHIPLSGHLYTHQAIEEKAPRFRRQVNNLDTYILSPVNKQIFLYGSPGSGKSTTLYKAFRSYKSDAIKGKGNYIPIFIHANQILKILSHEYPVEINHFLKSIYHLDSSDDVLSSFAELLEPGSNMNFVCIVDALDEFSDRTKRNELFNLLSKLIDTTSKRGTKWILSCREDEYRAYRRTLNVTNIRIEPMNLNQTQVFLSKRLKNSSFNNEDIKQARLALVNIQRLENKRESFLSNPYYLSLWFQDMLYNPEKDHSDLSLDKLHRQELKREMQKENKLENDDLIESIIAVLSVLSFYHIRVSLREEESKFLTTSITSIPLLKKLETPILLIKNSSNIDKITRQRLNKNAEIDISSKENEIFCIFKDAILPKASEVLTINQHLSDFVIILSSILEQAYHGNLIKLDIEEKIFLGFLNQRTGDYLAACYLRDFGLQEVLIAGKINFWLSRSIAIALASSEEPQETLDALNTLPSDHIFESAIVDGLALIPSKKHRNIKKFVERFTYNLLTEDRLTGESYHACYPLRALRLVRSLCLSGYSEYIKMENINVEKLLGHSDTSISEAAALTLLTYMYHVKFNGKSWVFLVKYFSSKAIKFNFVDSFNSLHLAIKDPRK